MEKTMEKIVALAKARGFVYPGSEIYGGLANTWDYGNLGVELKNNVKKAWWQKFVMENPYNVGVAIMPEEEAKDMVKRLEHWVKLRVAGIMEHNRRNYYGECAAFVAALGEVEESRGEPGAKKRIMEEYRSAYSRRTAFHQELRAFGMEDTRKRK